MQKKNMKRFELLKKTKLFKQNSWQAEFFLAPKRKITNCSEKARKKLTKSRLAQ